MYKKRIIKSLIFSAIVCSGVFLQVGTKPFERLIIAYFLGVITCTLVFAFIFYPLGVSFMSSFSSGEEVKEKG